jgi:hypothetical protein
LLDDVRVGHDVAAHPALFMFALYVIVFSSMVLVIAR